MKGTQLSAKSLKYLMALYIMCFCLPTLQSQITVQFQTVVESNDELIRQINQSFLFKTDLQNLDRTFQEIDESGAIIEFQMPQLGTFKFFLEKNEFRSSDYKLVAQTPGGKVVLPKSETITYRGYTQKGQRDVRMTVTPNFVRGFIMTDKGELFIETLSQIDETYKNKNVLVAYFTKDLKEKIIGECATAHKHEKLKKNVQKQVEQNVQKSLACKQVQIAIANDFEMMQDHGGNEAGVEAHVLSIMNLVETNYDDEFADELQFSLTEVFVSTCNSCDPWSGTNNIDDMLDEFRLWGPGGFSNTYDVATMWSPRPFFFTDDNGNMQNGVIGLAYVGVICGSFRYNVCEDYTNNSNSLRVLQAHEMGHNFGSFHDAPNSGFIMTPSVNNTTTWSQSSIDDINDEISFSGCLGPCVNGAPPSAGLSVTNQSGCVNLNVQFFDESGNIPTDWLWTFEGGNPSSSDEQNPEVEYTSAGNYSVTLEVTNAFGTDEISFENYIEAFEIPIAEFDFFTNNLQVQFENFSENFDEISWNFGDGNTSNEIEPTHIYEEDGFYTVVLTITGPCGTEEFEDVIEIATSPSADFSFDQNEGCPTLSVQFTEQASSNTLNYNWTFENGNPSASTELNPLVEWSTPGTYDVTLLVTNSVGDDVITQNNLITVLAPPAAEIDFIANDLTVDFTAFVGSNDTYFWEFGDGNSSNDGTTSHTYATGGTYTVQLVTTNECGTDMSTIMISLNSAPSASFTSISADGCSPAQIQFENTSMGTVDNLMWSFPGGNPSSSSESSPIVTYNNPGVFDVQLTASGSLGNDVILSEDYITILPGTQADFGFTLNGSSVVFDNLSIGAEDFEWLFGDGGSSIVESPNHNFVNDGIYEVMLIANGECGVDTFVQFVQIATAPEAGFSANESVGCTPFEVQFENTSSTNATGFSWTFEGGTPSISDAQNPLVMYQTPGTYPVQLVVTSIGGTDEELLNDFITVLPNTEADFSIENINELVVTFKNESANGTSFLWEFGDGEISTEPNPTHVYTAIDNYTVKLTVEGECGQDSHTLQFELTAEPIAQFSASAQSGCSPITIQFTDESLNNPTEWEWIFEGGIPATSNERNPTITYLNAGVYPVSLMSKNSAGSNVDLIEDYITVQDGPTSDFDFEITNLEVLFNDMSSNASSLLWDFGNGEMSTANQVNVVYAGPGQYTVQLFTFNDCGVDTSSQTVNIITTSIGAEDAKLWKLYPNPADQFIVLEGPEVTGKIKIQIINLLGQNVFLETLNNPIGNLNKRIDLTHFQEGVYYILLTSNHGQKIFEFVINR